MNKIINLSHIFRIIRLDGEKSEAFLQGQVTSDVREATENTPQLSAHCNPKGRVLSNFWIFKKNGDLYLCALKSMQDDIIKQLTPYARFSRVTLLPIENLMVYGFWGEISPKLTSISIIQLSKEIPRYFLIGNENDLLTFQAQQKTETTDDDNQWQLDDIHAGIANITAETTALFTPQMLNYDQLNAVSYKKGCYIGQEVIARTHYLGKAKRHLQKISITTNNKPSAGDIIKDKEDNDAGVIVSVAKNPENKRFECLAVVQNSALAHKLFLNSDRISLSTTQSTE